MRKIDREAFLPQAMREFAYEDSALPIEEGQTISQPYIVALMVEAARLEPGRPRARDRRRLGLCRRRARPSIARHACTRSSAIPRSPRWRATRLRASWATATSMSAPATARLGWPEAAPFDAIVVAAGGPRVPEALKDQLAIGGRLVMPVGDTRASRS